MSQCSPDTTGLLPCPFCGKSATMEQTESNRWSVGCDAADQLACMGYQNFTTFARRGDAVIAWNTRATQPAAPAGEEAIAMCICCEEHPAQLGSEECEYCRITYGAAPSAMAQSDEGEARYDLSGRRIRDTEDVGTEQCSAGSGSVRAQIIELTNGLLSPDFIPDEVETFANKIMSLFQSGEPDAWRRISDNGNVTYSDEEVHGSSPLYLRRPIDVAQPKQERTDLTKIAAECHRTKWQFDFNDEKRLLVGQARDMMKRAFDEMHRIGDLALKLRDASQIISSTHSNTEAGK